MTSYHLRGANPAKTRADAVVVGAHQTSKGVTLAEGGADVQEAFGRALRPLLSTLGFTGKAGEVAKIPTTGRISSPLLVDFAYRIQPLEIRNTEFYTFSINNIARYPPRLFTQTCSVVHIDRTPYLCSKILKVKERKFSNDTI